jgi:hypothetical protein
MKEMVRTAGYIRKVSYNTLEANIMDLKDRGGHKENRHTLWVVSETAFLRKSKVKT